MKTAEEIIGNKDEEMVCVSPGTTICAASALMVERDIGAVLVKEEGRIIGIWTERDLVHNIVKEGFDPKTALIRDSMNRKLIEAPHTDSAYRLMDLFLGARVRHILISRKNEYIGLISMGDAMKATLVDKNEEIKKLNSLVGWDYYEDWKWGKKKKKKQ